ncbi:MAG: hypothetical protein FWE82_01415 [Defluviitaleaceae bacterium]|nr:hypothetical protein [Defluviitaleaceae bacterium]
MKFSATIYLKGTEESFLAVEMYKEAFGLSLGYNLSYEDPEGLRQWGFDIGDDYVPQRGYFHADLVRGNETLFSVSAEGDYGVPHEVKFIELGMQMDSKEAVEKAVSVLSGGTQAPSDEGWNPYTAGVTDPFGVYWVVYI